MTAELSEDWGTALCDDFWGVNALTGGGPPVGGCPPVGGGPRGTPGWKVVGRSGFTKGGTEPMETLVFHMSFKNLRQRPKLSFTKSELLLNLHFNYIQQ